MPHPGASDLIVLHLGDDANICDIFEKPTVALACVTFTKTKNEFNKTILKGNLILVISCRPSDIAIKINSIKNR